MSATTRRRLPHLRRPTAHECDASVVEVSNGAVLFRRCDGSTRCYCPFLCSATYERCEFAGAEASA